MIAPPAARDEPSSGLARWLLQDSHNVMGDPLVPVTTRSIA